MTHYRDILAFYPEAKSIRFARKHLAGYCDDAGLGANHPLRVRICQGLDADDVAEALSQAFIEKAEVA